MLPESILNLHLKYAKRLNIHSKLPAKPTKSYWLQHVVVYIYLHVSYSSKGSSSYFFGLFLSILKFNSMNENATTLNQKCDSHRIINCFNMLHKILQPNQHVVISVIPVICDAQLMRTQVWCAWPKHFTASSRPFKTNYFLSSCKACPDHLDRVDCFQCNNIQCAPKVWKRSRQSGVLDSIWIHQQKCLLFSDGLTLVRDNTIYENIFYLI